jgi:hypothetical protein
MVGIEPRALRDGVYSAATGPPILTGIAQMGGWGPQAPPNLRYCCGIAFSDSQM